MQIDRQREMPSFGVIRILLENHAMVGFSTNSALPLPDSVLKNVTNGLQPGAPGAKEPECTEGVHEGKSGIGAAQPRPLAAPGDCDRRAGPPKADEHRASPDQGRADIFQHLVNPVACRAYKA